MQISHKYFIPILLLATALISAQAKAQTKQQIDWCNGDLNATADMQINGCNALIVSGRFKGTNLAFIYNRRGKGYYYKKNFDRAIADYNQALRIYPNFDVAYANRGNAYYLKGDYNRAMADYDQAVRISPRQSIYHNARGNVLLIRKDYKRAIIEYSEAIRLNPNDTASKRARAEAVAAEKKAKGSR